MDSGVFFFLLFGFVLATQGAQVDVEPKGEVLVLPGENVTFTCRLPVPLQYCRVEIPGMKPLNLNSKLSHSEVSFQGPGLSAGQCGFRINKVTDGNNGRIRCMLGVETEPNESVGQVTLIVAKAPRVPEMDLSRSTDSVRIYKVNDVLQASCIVRDGRPVANISWYLDEEPLFRDGLSMPTVMEQIKENMYSKIQNLTRTLQASDNGKHLRCVAFHPAYPGGQAETSRQLDVKFGPLPQGDLDKFGYTIGQPGVITVDIQANPRPFTEWDIGGERLKEGALDQTGRIQAEPIEEMGRGMYRASLRIAAINKHDTEKVYALNAYNDLGNQLYNIKISTSPEPEGFHKFLHQTKLYGLELGIGGIIGIIVSILIILVIVFILIFAKVTGRWCFSGPTDTKNLGESSDTESADVRPRDHRNFQPIKLTSFFKKNKDKVSSTEEMEPKKLEEEAAGPVEAPDKDEEAKEGLVYAELDLVSPQSVKPVVKNNDKTEYAEIVYTPSDDKKA